MFIIAGLGNPTSQYEGTRHNIGFDVMDALAEKYNISISEKKHKALCGKGVIEGEKVLLVKPQTYMNLSGEAIREAVNFYKIEPEELIVIYDDIDIPTGTFRIRKKGSAGTHNGMRSVVYQIQSDQFPRIRVGIGSEKKVDLINYVTGGVSRGEKELLEDALTKSAKAAACIIEKGIDKAMNEYNVRPPKKEKPAKQKSQAETPEAAANGETAPQQVTEAVKPEEGTQQ